MIPPRTMRDVASSLSTSSFRRVLCDSRVTYIRRVRTLGMRPMPTRPAQRP